MHSFQNQRSGVDSSRTSRNTAATESATDKTCVMENSS